MIPDLLTILASAFVAASAQDVEYMSKISRAIEHGRLVQAREMIGIAERSPTAAKSIEYQLVLGKLALAEEKSGDAFLHFKAASDSDSENCVAREGMGLAALRLGRINAAKASLDEALQRCPDRWQSLNALGVLADRKGDWEAGRIAYAKALALAPDQPAVLNNVGFSLLLQRRFGEAEIFLTKAMSLAPADERISNNLDLAQAGQGKPITASNEAQAYRLNNAGYMAYLGGNLEAAKSYFNEAIKLSPSYFERAASNLEMAEGRQEK